MENLLKKKSLLPLVLTFVLVHLSRIPVVEWQKQVDILQAQSAQLSL
jgi:hypothetical protein